MSINGLVKAAEQEWVCVCAHACVRACVAVLFRNLVSCSTPSTSFAPPRLFLFKSFSSSQILPVKTTGEKARGRNGGQQNLSEDKGPLRGPSSLLQNAPRDEDERSKKKKKTSLYFLKIDFCSLTGSQVASHWGRRAGSLVHKSWFKKKKKAFCRMLIFLSEHSHTTIKPVSAWIPVCFCNISADSQHKFLLMKGNFYTIYPF